MAHRYTNTEKWNDVWFCDLKPLSKLLFLYLCDQCDIAGFLEINQKKIAFDLGIGKQETEKAFEGIKDKIIVSTDNRFLYIINFLKHQKNLPLNEKSTLYKKIVELLESKLKQFDFQYINDFIEYPTDTPSVGYLYPDGNGNGNIETNITTPPKEETKKTWRYDFEVYYAECKEAFDNALNDEEYLKKRGVLNPKLNIPLTLMTAFNDFWGLKEKGWEWKKKQCKGNIDWINTITNSLKNPNNKVYL
jgi:hypothetical protein